jgi:geranylgeranyl diphosphate synthase type I
MTLRHPLETKLENCRKKVDKLIEEILETKKPEILYNSAKHIIKAGGKRLRPYLVCKSCEFVGGNPEISLPFAAAMEMLHSFTLIHDDIMDNDNLRRGVQTVHVLWGIPIAVASGDFLFARVYEVISKALKQTVLSEKNVLKCIEKASEAAISICKGQVLDITYPKNESVTEEDYLYMVGGKTSSLFKACAEIGAIVGGGSPKEEEALGKFAWNSGIAFQIMDDILGITANEAKLGKPVGSDLREGKKTLIIIHALKHASPTGKATIEKVLGSDNPKLSEIEEANKVILETGSIAYAKRKAEKYANKARKILESFEDSEAKKDMLEILDYFTTRKY